MFGLLWQVLGPAHVPGLLGLCVWGAGRPTLTKGQQIGFDN